MPLTTEQANQAKQLGIDLSKIDWTKVIGIIQLLIALFAAQKQQATADIKAKVGCDDAHAALMHEAICLNLQAADTCVQCCCDGGY